MGNELFLQTMRDPLGVPFYPIVFQGLSVMTFALHIIFVNLVVGGTIVAIWGHFSQHEWMRKLSRSLARITTINISIAIVLGVAPLLFVQVVYDPLWYSSNVISAWWTMVFLAVLIIGALSMYVFYLRRKGGQQCAGLFGLITICCLLVAATIIHALSMQALHPELWQGWIFGGTDMDTSGWGLHAIEIGRLFHFLAPALVNTGIFLMLYAWYFEKRDDVDMMELQLVANLGRKLAFYAALVTALVGLWWLLFLPESLSFMTDPTIHSGILLSLILIAVLYRAGRAPSQYALLCGLFSFLTVFIMTISRESLRMAYLKPFSYSIYDYPQTTDWGSTILFLATFLAGVGVVVYLVRIAFNAGRGEYAA